MKVFEGESSSDVSVLEVVKKSLDVDVDGNVSFRSRFGKGSGKSLFIPSTQFDAFVNLMVGLQKTRTELALKQQVEVAALATATDTVTTETTTV